MAWKVFSLKTELFHHQQKLTAWKFNSCRIKPTKLLHPVINFNYSFQLMKDQKLSIYCEENSRVSRENNLRRVHRNLSSSFVSKNNLQFNRKNLYKQFRSRFNLGTAKSFQLENHQFYFAPKIVFLSRLFFPVDEFRVFFLGNFHLTMSGLERFSTWHYWRKLWLRKNVFIDNRFSHKRHHTHTQWIEKRLKIVYFHEAVISFVRFPSSRGPETLFIFALMLSQASWL